MKCCCRILITPFLVGLLWLTESRECRAQEKGLSLRSRLFAEAPPKWVEYRLQGKTLQGSFIWTGYDRAAGGRLARRQYEEYKQNKDCASYLIQHLEGKENIGECQVISPRYAFRLRRVSPGSPWAIVGLNRNLSDGYGLSPLAPNIYVAAVLVDRPLTFAHAFELLPDMIKDADFSVKNVVPVLHSGNEWAHVDFAFVPKKKEYKHVKIPPRWLSPSGGWIRLDPNCYWLMQEYEVNHRWEDGSTGISRATFSYKTGESGLPILTHCVRSYKGVSSDSKPRHNEEVFEFKLTQKSDVPDT